MTSAGWSQLGERRRDALASYGVRGDEPDAGFDALVGLAAETCAVPVAAVTLMDESRQWYKARRGFDAISIEIESALCVHALDSGADVTIIPDTVADPRVATSPFVTEFGVRAYAGAPLIAPDGLVLGTVCVFDL